MMAKQIGILCYAVRWRVLLKYLGMLGVALAALNAVPVLAALVLGEYRLAGPYALVVTVLLAAALPLARMSASERLQHNEALVLVALTFLLGSLAMSYPLGIASDSWLDGWFEAVSGITTTGLSTAVSVEDRPRSFLFARAWMQWYGGLGIVILSLALVMRNGVAARRLIETEAISETLVSTTRIFARRIILVYGLLTVCAVFSVWWTVGDGFVALVHSLSAVSTGGFSSFDDSLASLDATTISILMLFSWLGAISFALYYNSWTRGPGAMFSDPEFRALVVTTLMLAALLWMWMPVDGRGWHEALMLAMSTQSTTGFSTVAIGDLDDASKLAMIGSMLVGGSVGSTAGGFKLLRLLIFLRLLQLALARAAAPRHAVIDARLGERRMEDDDLWRALAIMLFFAAWAFLSWLVFVAWGYPALDALFEVVSATGTVGLSTGITRPELEPLLKVLLCLNMLAGRVEIFALLVVLYPKTWFGKRSEA